MLENLSSLVVKNAMPIAIVVTVIYGVVRLRGR